MSAAQGALRRIVGAIFVVQGIHLFEHVVQLVQTSVLGRPDAESLGLLGEVVSFHGTEEWLHLGFNVAFLAALLWILPDVRAAVSDRGRVAVFVGLACGVELWHVVEHMAITGNMLANGGGCPCPGILDRFVPDTVLHLGYNALAFAGTAAIAGPILRPARPPASAQPRWLSGRVQPPKETARGGEANKLAS